MRVFCYTVFMQELHHKEFPKPIGLRKLLGPSFIILALGLGSGEVILWPYLASNYGLGIAWGALLGITFQFFINMEIERYALVRGESVFTGIARLARWPLYWFIASTFIGFGLPGIIAASAQVFGVVVGIENFKWIAIGFLILIGIILSAGKTVYKTMERLTKWVLLVGVPFIFVLAIYTSTTESWKSLGAGIIGQGDGFWFLPSGIALATFLAAFAYSGAGGNLNLTQSVYIKEKGCGMGVYAQKISGLFRGKKEEKIKLTGESFEINTEHTARFQVWWRRVNAEHAMIFWGVGVVSIVLLMLLSFSTTFGLSNNAEGIQFVINEGMSIGNTILPVIGVLFLFVVSLMLFQTQLGIMDSTSRIMSENAVLITIQKKPETPIRLSRVYHIFVWAQIVFGIVLFLLDMYEPRELIVLGAVINACAMFVHIGLVWWLNAKELPLLFQPALWRKIVMGIIFLFFGFFSTVVILDAVGVLHIEL